MSSLTMGESFIETCSPEESDGGCLAPPEQRKVRLDSSISTKWIHCQNLQEHRQDYGDTGNRWRRDTFTSVKAWLAGNFLQLESPTVGKFRDG